MKKLLNSEGFKTFAASVICIAAGLLIGYIVLLFINPAGAGQAIIAVMKNFFTYNRPQSRLKYFGATLVKTAPLLMCALSVLFSYKVGLFNIGASGQYTAGICVALYCALRLGWGWLPCMLAALAAGMILGALVGLLKAAFNVNEVIAGIMLNWIMLYTTNMILTGVKEPTSPYTVQLAQTSRNAMLPSAGLSGLLGNDYVSIAIPLAVIIALIIYVVLEKTVFGYELKASGFNKHAARYAGMNGTKNIILTLAVSGGLAGLGAAFYYLTGIEQWQCTMSQVPMMGFNGIAATFLGGLNPIGTIFSSYFIQHITTGGAYVDKNIYCSQISDLIAAVIIYLCGFVLFIKTAMGRAAKAGAEEASAAGEKGGEK